MSGRDIGIGVLGGGMISQVAHLPFYLADPRCRVIAVAESRPSLVEHLSGQGLRVVADYRELLQDGAIEAVVISAPRPAAGPLTLEALEAGKHVLVEKPMAHTADRAKRLVEAADSRGLTYAVGFMKRYDPGVQAAKAALDETVASGRLGRLLSATVWDHSRDVVVPPPAHKRPEESRTARFEAWPLWPEWLPEGLRERYVWFMNFASHDVNLISWFLPGDLEVLSATSPNADAVTTVMRFRDAPVTLQVSRTSAGRWLEGAEFLFEDGRIAMSIPSPMATDLAAAVTIDDRPAGLVNKPLETGGGWCFERQAHGFVDTLIGDARPATTGADGLADLRLIERIWRHIAGQA